MNKFLKKFDEVFFGFTTIPATTINDVESTVKVFNTMKPLRNGLAYISAAQGGYAAYAAAMAAAAGAPVAVPALVGAVAIRAATYALASYGATGIGLEAGVRISNSMNKGFKARVEPIRTAS